MMILNVTTFTGNLGRLEPNPKESLVLEETLLQPMHSFTRQIVVTEVDRFQRRAVKLKKIAKTICKIWHGNSKADRNKTKTALH